MTRRFYTAAEAAQILGLNPKTVIRQVKSGTLPGVQVGRKWFVPMSALDLVGSE